MNNTLSDIIKCDNEQSPVYRRFSYEHFFIVELQLLCFITGGHIYIYTYITVYIE